MVDDLVAGGAQVLLQLAPRTEGFESDPADEAAAFVDGAAFELNIVPHTLAETTLADCKTGRRVNLEVDLIARYLERLLLGDRAAQPGSDGLTEALLREHGFWK